MAPRTSIRKRVQLSPDSANGDPTRSKHARTDVKSSFDATSSSLDVAEAKTPARRTTPSPSMESTSTLSPSPTPSAPLARGKPISNFSNDTRESSIGASTSGPAALTQTTLNEHVVSEPRRSEPANLPDWVPSSLPSRVHKFADFADPGGVHFAIARIPPHATWGSDRGGGDSSRYLCIDDQPVEIWLPAVVVSKWFVDYQGNLQSPVKLSFSLLREVDKLAAHRWLSMTKPYTVNTDDVFWASRLMLEWPEDINVERPEPVAFTKIFDATAKYSAHEDLQSMMSRFVNVGNIVLVEANLTRYKPKGAKRTSGWHSWAAAFELQAVSVIARCPPRERAPAPRLKRNQASVNI